MEKLQHKKIIDFIKESLYSAFASADSRCLVCDEQLQSRSEYLCDTCKESLSLKNSSKCPTCGRLVREGMCAYCRKNKKPYEKVYSVFEYTRPIDTFINEFKEQGRTIYGKMFVKSLLDEYDDFSIQNIDIVTSVPANKIRKITRLRDAPAFFAKALSKHVGIRYSNKCLTRKGFSKAMRKKSAKERMQLASKNYFIDSENITDKNILLVDDVFTSGATAHVCSNLLLDNGAKSVTILAMVCVRSR